MGDLLSPLSERLAPYTVAFLTLTITANEQDIACAGSGTLVSSDLNHGIITAAHRLARGIKANPVEGRRRLSGFLTTDANAVVAPIHPKAMPVILRTRRSSRGGCGRLNRRLSFGGRCLMMGP